MNNISNPRMQDIVVDEVFPHSAETIWKALTTGELIARWLMEPTGFEAVPGNHFTYKTAPSGEWDGLIECEVLEVILNERLAYIWKGGHDANTGYGSKLNTIVTWSLTGVDNGTRILLVHSGFITPHNDSAFDSMGKAWPKVFSNLNDIASTLR